MIAEMYIISLKNTDLKMLYKHNWKSTWEITKSNIGPESANTCLEHGVY